MYLINVRYRANVPIWFEVSAPERELTDSCHTKSSLT